jgi:hypothetical protein
MRTKQKADLRSNVPPTSVTSDMFAITVVPTFLAPLVDSTASKSLAPQLLDMQSPFAAKPRRWLRHIGPRSCYKLFGFDPIGQDGFTLRIHNSEGAECSIYFVHAALLHIRHGLSFISRFPGVPRSRNREHNRRDFAYRPVRRLDLTGQRAQANIPGRPVLSCMLYVHGLSTGFLLRPRSI